MDFKRIDCHCYFRLLAMICGTALSSPSAALTGTITTRLSAGFGLINRSGMFAAIDDTVVLPGYTRGDVTLYYSLTERIRVQANCENVWNTRYTLNADNNTNLSPGSPRAVRVGVIARF